MAPSKPEQEALRAWLSRGERPALTRALALAAIDQGLAGLLLSDLDLADGSGVDAGDGAVRLLRDAARRSLVSGVRLLDLCERARRALWDRGLRSLPLKGTALGEWLYGSLADRPMLDADLLVLDAWPDAIQALLEEGYRDAAGADHARVLVDPVTGGILELHRSVTSCPGLFAVDPDGLWSRSLPAPGLVTRRPSDEDLLIQLCLHASFQHGLVLSLVQWLDLRRLLEKRTLDTARAAAIAERAGAVTAVAAALSVAEAVVAAPISAALREAFPLTPRLSTWLGLRLRAPHAFVAPAEAPLGRVRFEVTPGRRTALLTRSLAASGPGEGTFFSAGRRLVHVMNRWAAPTLRSWRGVAS
jgi:hypothetical protein